MPGVRMGVSVGRSGRSSGGLTPPNLGDRWGAMGDSHNFGYGDMDSTGAVVRPATCKTPFHAFTRIWQTKGLPGPTNPYTNIRTANVYQDGQSGHSLAQTRTRYNAWSGRTTRTFFALQESGSQGTGQTTATEFGNTWDSFVDAILTNTPNVILLYETAFSFRREGEAGRNWTDYNTELRARIAARNLPNQIFLCESDRDIKLLETAVGFKEVWFQNSDPVEANPYHFKAVGNLMIALSMFKALRYHNITLSDLADIGTGVVSTSWQQACLDIYNAN